MYVLVQCGMYLQSFHGPGASPLRAAPVGKPAGPSSKRAGTRSLAGDELMESAPRASLSPQNSFPGGKVRLARL